MIIIWTLFTIRLPQRVADRPDIFYAPYYCAYTLPEINLNVTGWKVKDNQRKDRLCRMKWNQKGFLRAMSDKRELKKDTLWRLQVAWGKAKAGRIPFKQKSLTSILSHLKVTQSLTIVFKLPLNVSKFGRFNLKLIDSKN